MNETHFFAAEDTVEDEEGEGEEDATSDMEPNSEPDSVDDEDAEDEEGDYYDLNETTVKITVSVSHIQYAPICLEHRKCIKMDLKCPTIVLNCLHILDYTFMVDLKSKNFHMGAHKGQNS